MGLPAGAEVTPSFTLKYGAPEAVSAAGTCSTAAEYHACSSRMHDVEDSVGCAEDHSAGSSESSPEMCATASTDIWTPCIFEVQCAVFWLDLLDLHVSCVCLSRFHMTARRFADLEVLLLLLSCNFSVFSGPASFLSQLNFRP
jgi:hypothetical protein